MRILKYIFLLLLLFLIGLSVFVSTQKATYDVTQNRVIKNQRATVFNYINDFKNWETFASWIREDQSIRFNYPELTIGKGASCTWTSNTGGGTLKTFFVKENDSLAQKMTQNGEPAELFWKFKDTVGGTVVTCRSKGRLDFKSKVMAFFHGGINAVVGDTYEKSLVNLNKTLNYEINTFKITVNGIVNRGGGFYLKQFKSCKQKDVDRNIKVMVPRMELFFEKNHIASNGKPFIVYHKYDKHNDVVAFSVGMPVRDSIHIMPGSDIESKKLVPYTMLKTTLVGDYSHTQAAWEKAFEYIRQNKLERNLTGQIIEVYIQGRNDIKNPSKWITEIYIPVYPKAAVQRPETTPADSTDSEVPKTTSETTTP